MEEETADIFKDAISSVTKIEEAEMELSENDDEFVPVDLEPLKIALDNATKAFNKVKKSKEKRGKAMTKPEVIAAKHSRLGFGRPQRLSAEMAAFMGLEVPIASVKICAYFIEAYRFLSTYLLKVNEPSRLVMLFKDCPEMLHASPSIAFGLQLQEMGLVSVEVVREQWNDTQYVQLENLLDDCRTAMQNNEQDVNSLSKRWLELGLTPFDAPIAE